MFFLKDKNKDSTSIQIIVRYKGQRYKYPTGESVDPNHWLKDRQRCKEGRVFPDGSDINVRLDIWEKHVKSVLNQYSMKFEVPTLEEFRASLQAEAYGSGRKKPSKTSFLEFAKNYKETCDRSTGTKNVYQTAINWIEAFEKEEKRILQFSDINEQFYTQFKAFVFKSGRIHSPNTFGTIIKNIKVFMDNSSGIHGMTGHQDPDFRKVEMEAENIYLTLEELTALHRAVVDEPFVMKEFPHLTPKLAKLKVDALNGARCKFLIGAFTALRVSDFSRIEEMNIRDNKIRIRTAKGDKAVVIPVHWIVKEIIDNGFDFSRKISDQKINKHIKKICKFAKITDPVSLTRFEKGKRITRTKEKCDWVSTHTARRSGATNMFIAGIPAISIMKITGHRTEKSFLKYIKISQEENAQLLSSHPFFVKEVPKKESPGDGINQDSSHQTKN